MIDGSTPRTLAQAADLLVKLSQSHEGLLAKGSFPTLLVGGESLARDTLAQALKKVGFDTMLGEEYGLSLRLASENGFALIIVNLDSSVEEGFKLCAALRQLIKNPETLIIGINGPSGVEHLARALVHGCTDLLSDTVCTSELVLRILLRATQKRIVPLENPDPQGANLSLPA